MESAAALLGDKSYSKDSVIVVNPLVSSTATVALHANVPRSTVSSYCSAEFFAVRQHLILGDGNLGDDAALGFHLGQLKFHLLFYLTGCLVKKLNVVPPRSKLAWTMSIMANLGKIAKSMLHADTILQDIFRRLRADASEQQNGERFLSLFSENGSVD